MRICDPGRECEIDIFRLTKKKIISNSCSEKSHFNGMEIPDSQI